MFKKTRMFGSAAMSLSYLASGKIDAYFEEKYNDLGCSCRNCNSTERWRTG